MRNTTLPFLALLTGLATLSGWLLSKISLVGKAGIATAYKEYRFLRTWWQAGGVVFLIWLLLFFLQYRAQSRLSPSRSRWVHIAAIVAAVAGLFFTYSDFRNDLSHRWLGERFHLGAYLFWIGWILVSIFFLTRRREKSLQ